MKWFKGGAFVFGLFCSGMAISKTCAVIPDLDFAYQTLLKNHPGVYNELDPTFKTVLDKSYKTYRDKMRHATKIDERKQLLEAFGDSFNDGHLRIRWIGQTSPPTKPAIDRGFEIERVASDIAWIRLPTFSQLSQEQNDKFNRLLESAHKLRTLRRLVLDIRGNGGGDSTYAIKLAEALYGKAYAQGLLEEATKKEYALWRVTAVNLKRLEYYNETRPLPWLKQLVDGMRAALEKGAPLFREPSFPSGIDDKVSASSASTEMKAQVFIVMDRHNASSALSFIDIFKAVDKNILLIGETTGWDTLYMDINVLPLPCLRGQLIYPMKVIRNRARGSRVPYRPDVGITPSDTAKIKAYLLKK